jgi:integrase
VFENGGHATNWAARTRKKAVSDYGRWIGWLRQNHNEALLLDPGARVTRDLVKEYAADLAKTLAPFTVQLHLQGLGAMMVAMTDSKDFLWIFRAANRLGKRAVSVKNKRQRIQPSYRLAELGFRLMRQAVTIEPRWHDSPAVKYRNGLIVALLAYCPMRMTNLSGIKIGEHLVRAGEGWRLIFTAAETKQGRDLEFNVPEKLNAPMDLYLSTYRPCLAAGGSFHGTAGQSLWVSRDGGPCSAGGLFQAIIKETKAAFGRPVNPHLFRDCAATTVAIDDPSHAYVIAPVLGHSSMDTSERHYNHAGSIEAAGQYHASLLAVRQTMRAGRARIGGTA